MNIGIIGGTGKMGQWFATVFKGKGHDVLVSGRTTTLTNEQLATKADVVIVSVPIADTVAVIDEIAPLLKEEQLLMDFTSVKTAPVEAMSKTKAEVIGLHPMFNQHAESLAGQHIVFCPARAPTWEPRIRELFSEATLTTATPEEHDTMMAIVQVMNHFNLISFGHALAALDVDIKHSLNFSSPLYKLHVAMTGRVLAYDADLYSQIGLANKETDAVLRSYFDSLEELKRILGTKNTDAFAAYFKKAATHFHEQKEDAIQTTNTVLAQLK
ncbi:MAG: prephenate dehydrogenase/arogenate dehydrogenase family protein [Candidatus Woesearchaeota archaeon]|nr:prephenate dehydrogenase/arogenate dehydrogenase family protein [Candidatus Woesearchaeota archaeon]